MVLPCFMTALNSIGGSCFGWAGGRIQTEATLLFFYAGNVEDLRAKVQDLSDAIKAVENRIEEAANRGETLVVPIVGTLLKRMISLHEKASKLIVDEERSSDSRCLMGLRFNLWACYLASKSAKKVIDEAAELLEKEKTLDRVVAIVDLSNFLGVTPIEEFEEFESRALVSEEIVAALKDPKVNKVGIYGMGGTGKTTLAEKICAKLQLDGTVSFVVLATVSEKQNQRDNNYQPDLFNIQKQIAGGFKIQLQGETLKDRAVELCKQLQKKDKVLIIFDDIWSGFELKDVGIPIDNVDKKFKILMTSRSEAVLRKEMNSTKNFGLDSLPHPDAWLLFDRMVGVDSEYSKWRPTAELVVKQCGGIPILLVTIAKALRNEVSESWEDALTQLKQFDGEDILEEPYKMIEVSYKFLKSEEKKKVFLLCAQLNHRGIAKDHLLKYAMGLNMFKGCKTLKEVRNRLHRYLNDLKGCCLLQDANKEGIIKMHDVVHKFASYVAFRDHHVFSVANDGELQGWPSKDELEHFSAISLPECDLPPDQMLPAVFDNPDLESFLMLRGESDASFKMPNNFFAGMRGLKLMHLRRMSLSPVLVSSFEALVKLRTLCLDDCELSDISVIGELPMLQVLSLIGSSIVLVPKEIGKLGRTLKLLDLRCCEKLERIAAGVIFRLTLLEDLRIGSSCKHWERLEGNHKSNNIVDERNDAEMASMEEFKNLPNLINVEIDIHELAEMFPKNLIFKKLETFKVFFGSHKNWCQSEYISRKTLEVYKSTAVELDCEGSKALMTSAESIYLEGVMGFVTVSEMDQTGFPELKHLQIRATDGIEYIVKKNYNTCIFPKLETLDLSGLFKLERICDHPLLIGSFENLRVINVNECHLLNHLLSSNFARVLLRLQEMRVETCESMENIIISKESENEAEIQIGFTHQLRILKLYNLPCLLSFCSFKQASTPLFNKKIMFPKMEVLKLKKMKIKKIWDDHLAIKGICWFQNLTRLDVSYCDNLTYLFTYSMIKSLAQLKELQVSYCESIEEIFLRGMEGEKLLLFPKLEKLTLLALPKFKRFCHANLLECPSLGKLTLWRCPLFNAFIDGDDSSLFDKKIVFPKLELLHLNYLGIKKIWDVNYLAIAIKETTCWFQNLISVVVSQCNNLRYLFPSSMVKNLAQLEELIVDECDSIEEIVASTAEDVQLLFPKLGYLKLKNLPNLKIFCQNNLFECKLVIQECPELKTFVSVNDSSSSDNSTTLFTEEVGFPTMHHLKIVGCPSLTSICRTSIVPTSLQQLKEFDIRNCDEIDFFGFNNTQQLNDAFAKLISSLKYCHIDIGGLKLTYENQRVTLQTVGRDFQGPRVLFAFLKSFPELDEVAVSDYSIITKLFPCEFDHLALAAGDDMDTEAKTLARIRHLRLTKLSNMKQIWSEHSPLKYHVIPQLLEVVDCDSLLTLAPPSPTLFKNLTSLVVWDCRNLIKLVLSSSTAKSLVNLEAMSVGGCDSLEEIVVVEDQWGGLANIEEYIVFEKLKTLDLQDMDILISFCSTSGCNFKFPSLTRVVVNNCPKMKFFSKGALSTPNLMKVRPFWVEEKAEESTQSEGRWEGDLNSTIRQLFEEKVTNNG